MVQLTDITDDKMNDYYTTSDDDDMYEDDLDSMDSITNESFLDRILALQDIIPPNVRFSLVQKLWTFTNVTKFVAVILGKLGWVVSTSALIMVAPLVYEMEKESHLDSLDKEQLIRDQSKQQLLDGGDGPSSKSSSAVPLGF